MLGAVPVRHGLRDVFRPVRARVVVMSFAGIALFLCLLYADRPLALWLDRRFRGTVIYVVCLRAFYAVEGLGIVGAVLLALGGGWWIIRRKLPRRVVDFLSALLVAALTLGLTELLKWAVGRSQVDPVFLREHVYGVRPFAGRHGYGAFPSATMSVSSAFLAGLGLGGQRSRIIAAVVLSLMVVAMLITNGHWLTDILAGTLLGLSVGAAASRRRLQRP